MFDSVLKCMNISKDRIRGKYSQCMPQKQSATRPKLHTLQPHKHCLQIPGVTCKVRKYITHEGKQAFRLFPCGFMDKRSTTTKLHTLCFWWTETMEGGVTTGVVYRYAYMDYMEAFDKVPHERLIRIIYPSDIWHTWWRHQMETFSALLAICAGNSPVPVNSPHKGQWRGALMFSLICARINGWVNNREAGDLRRYRAHYDVIVMTHSTHGIRVSCLWIHYTPREDM